MKQVAETWPLSLCEKMCEARRKQICKLFCPPLPVQHMSRVFGYLLNVSFPDPTAPVCSGLQTSTAIDLCLVDSNVMSLRAWDGRLCGCSPGYGISQHVFFCQSKLCGSSQIQTASWCHASWFRRILQHPVLSRVEEWNWTAMHEDHACMLYLNPFVSAINDHQLIN